MLKGMQHVCLPAHNPPRHKILPVENPPSTESSRTKSFWYICLPVQNLPAIINTQNLPGTKSSQRILCVYHCGRIFYREANVPGEFCVFIIVEGFCTYLEDFVWGAFVLGVCCPGRILCVSCPEGFVPWRILCREAKVLHPFKVHTSPHFSY